MRNVKIVLSSLAMLLGLTTIAVTFAAGGGILARGVLLGAVLAVMGGLRLYLTLWHEGR
ncbi:MAG: hypothetical protein JJE27_00255 [Thermoleophilia bacterium]|nr:hypothetical protein [Thermoleophilia bacterium]